MDVKTILQDAYNGQVASNLGLSAFQKESWSKFSDWGLPALKHEEWRYTRIRNQFTGNLDVTKHAIPSLQQLSGHLLPGLENANRIAFFNGYFTPELSMIAEGETNLIIQSLDNVATEEDADFVSKHLGHSAQYHPDGINALNGAFAAGGVYIRVKKGRQLANPLIIYHFADTSNGLRFCQPRILANLEAGSQALIAEQYINLSSGDSLTNQVTEICTGRDAVLHYVKIQDEGNSSSHTGTTHIRQLEKALTHAVTLTLSGKVVRNNLNMVMEAEHGESHMYGLYLLDNETLADNHTIVDNAMPHCYSNELYKGIMDGQSSGVFNGKIFVRKDAQKTNAYQSNKNILIGSQSSANTKPQLEIFADDVKCSHGCTIGKLDDDALFYLRARGISIENARALLLHAFAMDILEQIKDENIRNFADRLVSNRLSFQI
jgi:Fe-S cluster assembly protein SufD